MRTVVDNAPEVAQDLLRAKSATWSLETNLRQTPRWRYRRRADLLGALEGSRRRERQALHLLGADVAWPYEYWPG